MKINCFTCKYGYEDERLGIPMCHHPKRFSEDCVNFNMHEEKETEESEKPNNHDGIDKKAGKRLRRVCNLAEELKEDRPLEERLQELKEIRAKKGLDEAAKEYVKDIPTFKDSCLMKAAFEDGWLSCNEQMLKEAVEGTLGYEPHLQRPIIRLESVPDIWDGGCKQVRVIIVKED